VQNDHSAVSANGRPAGDTLLDVAASTRPTAAAREAIVSAAAELMLVQGVSGMAISDLIARSGTSAGAIYHHFGNKQGVVMAVARRVIAGPVHLVLQTSRAGGLSPADLLGAALAHVAADEHTPALVLQIWAGAKADPELLALLQQEVAGVKAAAVDVIRSWCERGRYDIDPEGATEVLIGLVMGFAVQRALMSDWHPEAYQQVAQRLLAQLEDSLTRRDDDSA
jgi:AcrR family transcriptional regulator